jgi:hypothetical protein
MKIDKLLNSKLLREPGIEASRGRPGSRATIVKACSIKRFTIKR